MTNEEIQRQVANAVRVWLEAPAKIGTSRPSIPAVLEAIGKILEQAEPSTVTSTDSGGSDV